MKSNLKETWELQFKLHGNWCRGGLSNEGTTALNTKLGDTVNFSGKEPMKDLRRVPRNNQRVC